MEMRLTVTEREFEEIFHRFASPLRRRLRLAFPQLQDDVLENAVEDALLDVAARPGAGLAVSWMNHFLQRAAWRNAANASRSDRRRQQRLEHYGRDVLTSVTRVVSPRRDLASSIALLADNAAERAAIAAWIDGECRTTPLAIALGLADRPVLEQRREIKRFKDRVLKRAMRLRPAHG